MKAVGVYARISSDVVGEGLGVQRQQEDCDALAAARGWRVVDRYVDNDISAFSGKRRPEYERMLGDVRSGRIAGILAWHTDRLHRSPKELETFIDLVESTSCTVDTVKAGAVDLTTPSGRAVARTLGAWARYESEHKSERVRRKLEQNAQAGKIHGGRRPFGWDDDRVTLRPAEAAAVRLASTRILGGASIKSICREFDAAGITNTEGNRWQHATLRAILLRPRNAGLRQHRGEIVGKGEWEPILDTDTYDDVRRVLMDPARRTTPGSLGRTRLLSGLALCGVCGGPMRAAKGKVYNGKVNTIYRCKAASCVTRDLVRLEEYVAGLVCARLSQPDTADLLAPKDTRHREVLQDLGRLRQRLDDAAADYADDRITGEQLRTITARLRPQIDALDALSAPPVPVAGALAELVAADNVEAVWQALDVRQQREVIGLLVTVTVQRTRKGHGAFDYSAIDVEWRQS